MEFNSNTFLVILAIIALFYFMSGRQVETKPKKEKYCAMCK